MTSPEAADTVGSVLAELSASLGDATEARWVLSSATRLPAAVLATRSGEPLGAAPAALARRMAERRRAGEPLQYVLGTWAFRTLEVVVDRRVLVPRPETEQVVGFALDELARIAAGGAPPAPVAVDLGTGSGVIALSLAAEGPRQLEVWATDVSADALAVARCNLDLLAVDDPAAAARVRLAPGAWFDALPGHLAGRVHLIVTNPPYVSSAEWEALDPVVRDHEPSGALVAGPTGLEDLEHIVDRAPRWLAPGGALVAELAPQQASSVRSAASARGYRDVTVRPDLAGRPRVLVARWGR